MKCQRCGLPILEGIAGYAGPQCKCFTFYNPAPNASQAPPPGCTPMTMLSEADVRRIVREELAMASAAPAAAQGDAKNAEYSGTSAGTQG